MAWLTIRYLPKQPKVKVSICLLWLTGLFNNSLDGGDCLHGGHYADDLTPN